MALSVVNQWTAAAGDQDPEITTYPTSGNWLLAVIACRVTDRSTPLLNVGDISRNLWVLLASEQAFAHGEHTGAQLQAEVWACPAARFDGWDFLNVYASAMQITAVDVGSMVVNVFEVSGFAGGSVQVDGLIPGTASAATSFSLALPGPGANCLQLGVASVDNATPTITLTSAGWTGLTQVSNTAPDVRAAAAWRASSGAQTASWSSSAAVNWAGVAVGVRETAVAPYVPVQPNPNWTAMQLLVGLGYDASTPPSRVRFTDQTKRLLSIDAARGIQAELGVAQQGQADLKLRDDDAAYSPRTAGTATANAAGTTTTVKVPDAQATNIHAADFFRLKDNTGTLKEFAVFQVTATSSAAGTTTVTFARADGRAGGAMAATASGDVYAGIPIDLYIPYQLRETVGGKTYVTATGSLRDLPIAYDGARWATVDAEASDALETLATADNPSALRGEILRRNPYAYWPLDDSAAAGPSGSGSGYAQNASGRSVSVLTQTKSKYGVGGNSNAADFGASSQGVVTQSTGVATSLLGDSGSCWQQTGMTGADIAAKGFALVGQDAGFPSITNGVTIFGAMTMTNDSINITQVASGCTVDPTVMIIRTADAFLVGQGGTIRLTFDHNEANPTWLYAKVTVWDKVTKVATTTTCSTGGIRLADIVWKAWALVFDQTSWACYVAGSLVGSGSCNLSAAMTTIDVGGEADQFVHGRCFPALHAHIAVFDRKLSAVENDVLDNSMALGSLPSENSAKRIQKKLNTIGWKGARILNTASFGVSGEGTTTGKIADLCSEVAGYEDGLFFVDAAGQSQYRGRLLSYRQRPRATLGERTDLGEIPYQPGMSPSFNPTFLYNAIQVANEKTVANWLAPSQSTFVATDDVSANRYGPRTLPRSTRFSGDSNVWDVAWWYLARYAYPQQRVEKVVVEARADPSRWAFLCGIEVGDLIVVNKRPIGAPAYSLRCRVLNVATHRSYGDGGTVTGSAELTLAAAPPVVTILNDTDYGIVGTTVLGA